MSYDYVTLDLAQGGIPSVGRPLPFNVLVLCAEEYQPAARFFVGERPGLRVLHVPLDDNIPTRDEERLARLAGRRVADYLRRGNMKVLTTCYAGRNRSGLVNGLALVEMGMSSTDAIRLIRSARRAALTNTFFCEVIHRRSRELNRDSARAVG